MDLNVCEIYTNAPSFQAGAVSSASNTSASFADVFSTALVAGETGYDSYFDAAAEAYDIPASLLKAVGFTESGFTPTAVSSCGAQGIMQLMPKTSAAMGVSDPFDPAQNIMGGAKCLRMMLDRYDGDVSLALAAYGAGPGNVDRAGGVPSYMVDHVAKVLRYAETFSDTPVTGASAATTVSAASAASSAQPAAQAVLSTGQSESMEQYDSSSEESISMSADEILAIIKEALHTDDLISSDIIRVLMQQNLFQYLEDDDEEDSGWSAV